MSRTKKTTTDKAPNRLEIGIKEANQVSIDGIKSAHADIFTASGANGAEMPTIIGPMYPKDVLAVTDAEFFSKTIAYYEKLSAEAKASSKATKTLSGRSQLVDVKTKVSPEILCITSKDGLNTTVDKVLAFLVDVEKFALSNTQLTASKSDIEKDIAKLETAYNHGVKLVILDIYNQYKDSLETLESLELDTKVFNYISKDPAYKDLLS